MLILSKMITRCNMLLLIQLPEAPNSLCKQHATNMESRRAAYLLWILLLPNADCQRFQQGKQVPFTGISFIRVKCIVRPFAALHYSSYFGSSI